MPSFVSADLEAFKSEIRTVEPSIDKKIASEGLLLDPPPTFVSFKGQDGLKLEISLPTTGPFDYTLMFWFRSHQNYNDLSKDPSI